MDVSYTKYKKQFQRLKRHASTPLTLPNSAYLFKAEKLKAYFHALSIFFFNIFIFKETIKAPFLTQRAP